MLKSRSLNPSSPKFGLALRTLISILLPLVVLLTFLPPAFADGGGNFVLSLSPPQQSSVDPGVSTTATITVGSTGGFSDPVALSCAVTSSPLMTNPPTCVTSPTTVTPVGSATLTINTTTTTSSSLYTITVTGSASSGTQMASLNVTVLAVTPEYTITVTTPMSPSSVHAGSGATAGITVTPLNGYTGSVTLSCSAISPVVTPNAPLCSFLPQPVAVAGTTQTSTLTITTFGSATAEISRPGIFYALWLPVAGLALSGMGLGFSDRRRRKFFGLVALCVTALGLVLTPACGSSSTTSTSTSGVTPKNTYTFTLNAADANAVAPSNTGPTVSLTVN